MDEEQCNRKSSYNGAAAVKPQTTSSSRLLSDHVDRHADGRGPRTNVMTMGATTDCNMTIHQSEAYCFHSSLFVEKQQQETAHNFFVGIVEVEEQPGAGWCDDTTTIQYRDGDDDGASKIGSNILSSLLQPTPLNEEATLQVVQEFPMLSEHLLVEARALRQMLKPLQKHQEGKGDWTRERPSSLAPQETQEDRGGEYIPSLDQGPYEDMITAFISKHIPSGGEHTADGSQVVEPCFQKDSSEWQSCEVTACMSAYQSPAGTSPETSLSMQMAIELHGDDQEEAEQVEDKESKEEQNQRQEEQYDPWTDRYNDLLTYIKEHGNCKVPHHYVPNLKLSKWVKRQRHQYQLKQRGLYSNLLDERQMLLDGVGFVWDSKASNWENRLDELKAFREKFGHVQVPFKQKRGVYRNLAVWLKRQRSNARKLHSGDRSTRMTDRQLHQLLKLGVNLNTHLVKTSNSNN